MKKINHKLGHITFLFKIFQQLFIENLLHIHRNLLIGHEINVAGDDQHFDYMK